MKTSAAEKPLPNMPAPNPWLAESVYPTSHFNSAATDSVLIAGPTVGRKLTRDDVKTVPVVFSSNPTVKNIGTETVVMAGGSLGIQKILATGESFEPISFLPYPGYEARAQKADAAAIDAMLAKTDAARRAKDDARLLALSKDMADLGFSRATVANGTYNLIDRDGFHYAPLGGLRIVKTTDDNEARKPLRFVKIKAIAEDLPADQAQRITREGAETGGAITAMGMAYDGHIAAASPGALFLLDRDLNLKGYLLFSGEAVENNISFDEQGIYVVTSRHMMKVVWTGAKLSYEEADGGWRSEYNTMSPEKARAAGALTVSGGSGTTPTLMGFGDDPDKLVIISDGDENGTNLVAFWRHGIPAGFKQRPGTRSARIADQIKIDISTTTIEPSPNVLGNGVLVANTSYPKPVPDLWGNALTSGVTRPAPMGAQKFHWNHDTRSFEKAWLYREVDNTDTMVPVVSAKSGLIYFATKTNGDYEYVGVDWATGKVKARWPFPDDSRKWNTAFGITTLLEDGDFLLGGFFAVKRVHIGT